MVKCPKMASSDGDRDSGDWPQDGVFLAEAARKIWGEFILLNYEIFVVYGAFLHIVSEHNGSSSFG